MKWIENNTKIEFFMKTKIEKVFNFENFEIRIKIIDNEIWLVGWDICNVINIKKPESSLKLLHKEDTLKLGSLSPQKPVQQTYVML